MAPFLSRARSWLTAATLAVQVFNVDTTGVNHITAISPTSISAGWATPITFTFNSYTAATGDKISFLAACGAAPSINVVTGGSPTSVTVAAAAVGLKLCMRSNGQTDSVKQATLGGADVVLTVVAATPANKFTQIAPTSIYASTASAIVITGTGISGDLAIFTPASSGCAVVAPNVALTTGTNQATTFTLGSTGAGLRLCIRNAGGSDSIAQDGIFLSVSAAGGAGADPVTWYGDQVHVFSLPVQTLLPLMSATDMVLHGQTFAYGGPWQQWFNRMVLSSPDGERWVEIRMKTDILEFNRSRAVKGAFESMEVTLGHGSFDNPTFTSVVPSPDFQIPLNFLGFDIHFWKMNRNARVANSMIGTAHRECMEVAGANVHFYICSAPAHEFYGWQRDLAVQYAHLDLAIIEVLDGEKLTGTLPELWGMQPMSKETEGYVIKEEAEKPATSSLLPKLPEGSLPTGKGWAGGIDFGELANSCKQGNTTVLGCGNTTTEPYTYNLTMNVMVVDGEVTVV